MSLRLIDIHAYLEPRLRNEQSVSRLHRDILRNIAVFEQIIKAYIISLWAVWVLSHDNRSVPGCKPCSSLRRDHDVEQRKLNAIGHRERLRDFANHSYLLIEGTSKVGHH